MPDWNWNVRKPFVLSGSNKKRTAPLARLIPNVDPIAVGFRLPFSATRVIHCLRAKPAQTIDWKGQAMTNEASAADSTSAVSEQGADVAPEKGPAKKGASQKKNAPKAKKTAHRCEAEKGSECQQGC